MKYDCNSRVGKRGEIKKKAQGGLDGWRDGPDRLWVYKHQFIVA